MTMRSLGLPIGGLVVLCGLLVGLLLPGTALAAGTTYYVSPNGNDRGPGTSPERPWRTLDRVNGQAYQPGDRILLEGGQTLRGGLHFDGSSRGTADRPIVIGSYGSGRGTIDAGKGTAIYVEASGGFAISNLNVTGSGRESNTGDGVSFFNNLPRDRKLAYVRIDNVDVGGFGSYGITIGGWNGASGYRDVRVTGVLAHDNGKAGIITYGEEMYANADVYVGNSTAFGNAGVAGLDTNSGNGIVLGSVDGGTIERSLAYDNGWLCDSPNGGPVGIWAYNARNITIQYNESHHNRTAGQIDGGGFDLDHNVSDSVMQYNYSHDNEGAGFLLAQPLATDGHTNTVVRYNISENDARKSPKHSGLHVWGGVRNAEIYNNTVFTSASDRGSPRAISIVNAGIRDRFVSGIHVRNNIVQTTGGVTLVEVEPSALVGARDLLFQGNVYYAGADPFRIVWGARDFGDLASWRADAGQEQVGGRDVGLAADPLLALPGGGGTIGAPGLLATLAAYQLQDGSPAIDAGIDLGAELGIATGSRDFFGRAVPQQGGYDVGAAELGEQPAGDDGVTLGEAGR
jgi:hypothetical protein